MVRHKKFFSLKTQDAGFSIMLHVISSHPFSLSTIAKG